MLQLKNGNWVSYKSLNRDNRDWKQNCDNTTDNWSTQECSSRWNSPSSWAPSLLWTKDEKMNKSVLCDKTWPIKMYPSDLLPVPDAVVDFSIYEDWIFKNSIKNFNFYYFLSRTWHNLKKYSIHRCKSEHLESFINLSCVKILPWMITIFMTISGSP